MLQGSELREFFIQSIARVIYHLKSTMSMLIIFSFDETRNRRQSAGTGSVNSKVFRNRHSTRRINQQCLLADQSLHSFLTDATNTNPCMIKYITKRLNKSQKLKVENKIIQKKTDREKKVAFYVFLQTERDSSRRKCVSTKNNKILRFLAWFLFLCWNCPKSDEF